MPTPLKPDPLGLESSLPFKGSLSSRNTTKLKSVPPYTEQEHNETEDDYDCRRLEEEFEAEYDYPSQEEDERTCGRIEQQPAETTDSGNEMSSNSDSEEENNYRSASILHQEESSYQGKKRRNSTAMPQQDREESFQRGKKRRNEEREEEEGEVSDDGDGNQSQVNRTNIKTYRQVLQYS